MKNFKNLFTTSKGLVVFISILGLLLLTNIIYSYYCSIDTEQVTAGIILSLIIVIPLIQLYLLPWILFEFIYEEKFSDCLSTRLLQKSILWIGLTLIVIYLIIRIFYPYTISMWLYEYELFLIKLPINITLLDPLFTMSISICIMVCVASTTLKKLVKSNISIINKVIILTLVSPITFIIIYLLLKILIN